MDRGPRLWRRLPLPQQLDQPLDGHQPPALQREDGQQGALLPATQQHRRPVSLQLDRSEQPDVHIDTR